MKRVPTKKKKQNPNPVTVCFIPYCVNVSKRGPLDLSGMFRPFKIREVNPFESLYTFWLTSYNSTEPWVGQRKGFFFTSGFCFFSLTWIRKITRPNPICSGWFLCGGGGWPNTSLYTDLGTCLRFGMFAEGWSRGEPPHTHSLKFYAVWSGPNEPKALTTHSCCIRDGRTNCLRRSSNAK